MVVRIAALLCAGVGTCLLLGLLSLSLGIEDVLLSGAECSLDLLDGGVDSCEVGVLVGFFELAYSALDSRAFVGRYLVAQFAELFLGLVDDSLCLVQFVYALFLACVGFGVGLFHFFNNGFS